MLKISDRVWVGDSGDESHVSQADFKYHGIGAILNVACDMVSTRGWNEGLEVMHVGLVDGPGNVPTTYVAAVLALHSMVQRHSVLVCCHSGGRSLAVALMYIHAVGGQDHPSILSILQERFVEPLPVINDAHFRVFTSVDWRAVAKLMRTKQ